MEQQSSPLLALPREIRDEIYAHLFALPLTDPSGRELPDPSLLDVSSHIPHSPLGLPSCTDPANPAIPFSLLAPLCKANRQLYWEATPFYLSYCILSIDSPATTKFLMNWIGTWGEEGWKAIRGLEFSDFAPKEESIDHEFISRCPNLRSLGVRILHTDRSIIIDREFATEVNGRFNNRFGWLNSRIQKRRLGVTRAFYIAEMYNLAAVLDVPKLERFSFVLPDEKDFMRPIANRELRSWLRREWEERGRCVEIQGDYDRSVGSMEMKDLEKILMD